MKTRWFEYQRSEWKAPPESSDWDDFKSFCIAAFLLSFPLLFLGLVAFAILSLV